MPKQIWKIDQFHGGLNSNADPRDIDDNQLSSAVSCMVDEIGVIRTMGGTGEYGNSVYGVITGGLNYATISTIEPGYGLFAFKADRTGAGVREADVSGTHTGGSGQSEMSDSTDPSAWPIDGLVGATVTNTTDGSSMTITSNTAAGNVEGTLSGGTDDDWDNGDAYIITAFPETGDYIFAYSDADNTGKIYIYSYDSDSYNGSGVFWGSPISGLTNVAGGNRKDVFYAADGSLRICDSNFGNSNSNKSLGYVYSKLYQTTAGAHEHLIDKWVYTDQELKSLDDLSIDLVLDDCSAGNPDTSSITNDKTRLVIGWWTSDGGDWKGKYYVGVSPVFAGGQEGSISIPDKDAGNNDIDGTITINSEVLNIQVFVCQGNAATVSDQADHLLGDDRITGLKLYTKAFPSETWYLLKEIDLVKGGKFGWADYSTDNATGNGSGIMGGTPGKRGTDSDIYARFDDDSAGSSELTMEDGGAYHEYEKATAHFEVDIGTHTFGAGREGQLRVSGFHISPVYGDTAIDLNSASQQDINISGVVLPTEGVVTFTFEILDENFNVLHSQDGIITVVDSGAGAPSGGDPGGGGDEDDPYSETYF